MPPRFALQGTKTVVIGGAGFLGGHLVEELETKGADVIVFDVRPPPTARPARTSPGKTTVVVGDLCKLDDLVKAFTGVHVVFNVASPHPESSNIKLFDKVNIEGTQVIIEACKKTGVQRLVLTSSASVLYSGVDLENGDESLPYSSSPQDYYCYSKIQQEKLVLSANCPTLMTVAIRPHFIYGPFDQPVTAMVQQGRAGRLKYMIGNGKNLTSVTFVKNVAHAMVVAAENLFPGSPACGQTYHVDDGTPVGFWTFAGDVMELWGMPRPSIALPYNLLLALSIVVSWILSLLRPLTGEIKFAFNPSRIRLAGTHHYYSSARAVRDLGFKPPFTTKEGLAYTRKHSPPL